MQTLTVTDSRAEFRKLMIRRSPDSSLLHVGRGLISRYVDIATNGEWSFGERRPDAEKLAENLGWLFGVRVKEVRFISASQPYGDLEWITEEQFVRIADDGLAEHIANSVDPDAAWSYSARLASSLDFGLIRRLGEHRREIIDNDIARTFKGGLRSAIFSSFVEVVGVRRCEQMTFDVEETLKAFLGCIALDDREVGVPLGHMTRILTEALPLGEKRDDLGTWLFLTR